MTKSKALSLLGLLALVLLSSTARAHPIGISRGDYRATHEGLEASLAFAETELRALHGEAAQQGDPLAALARDVLRHVNVSSGGKRCHGNVRAAERLLPDGVRLALDFRCETRDAKREIELTALFDGLARGHRHEAASVSGETSDRRLLFEGQTRLELAPALDAAAPAPTPSVATTAAGFVHMGVEHIVLGFDHLVFLLGLVVVGLEKRRVLGIVTAFTLAHSLTLALSVLGVWSPPGSVVEPLIALSVAYVGIENFVARSFERRTLLAFAFGLVHGFGFAGALGEVGFDGAATSIGLVAFNAGVELGQLAVLALLLPLLAGLRRSPALVRRVVPAVNAAVVVLGVTWFVLRVARAAS